MLRKKLPVVVLAALLLAPGIAGHALERAPLSTICIDAESGLVLHEENADERRPPASMVKLVLMLMVCEGIEEGRWDLDTPITASPFAQSMGGTQVHLAAGEEWDLEHMMRAVAVASANDASVAVAEALWGSLPAYLAAANRRVLELGMYSTEVNSANGLPPDPGEPFDLTTARDMTRLARECLKHPRLRGWVGQTELSFRGAGAKRNTNLLLSRMPECDGLKTGYINAAGFCITATAERNGVRVISVVMGSPGKYERFNLAQELMEDALTRLDRKRLVVAGSEVGDPVPVRFGRIRSLRLRARDDLWVQALQEELQDVQLVAEHPAALTTPLAAGDEVGMLEARVRGRIIGRTPLIVPENVEAHGWRLTLSEGAARWEGLERAHLDN